MGAKSVGLLKMLVNKQSLTTIMGRMLAETGRNGPWTSLTGFKAQSSLRLRNLEYINGKMR
jgi:hypothetical protein